MNKEYFFKGFLELWPDPMNRAVKVIAVRLSINGLLSVFENIGLEGINIEQYVIEKEDFFRLHENTVGKYERYPTTALYSIDLKKYCSEKNLLTAFIARSAVCCALLSPQYSKNDHLRTIQEASTAIRLIITKSTNILNQHGSVNSLVELIWKLTNTANRYHVSQAFARLVESGWERLTNLSPPVRTTPRIRRRGNSNAPVKPPLGGISLIPIPCPPTGSGNELDIEDELLVNDIDLDDVQAAPIADAQRKIFDNRIQHQNDLFGLSLIPAELSMSEKIAVRKFLYNEVISDEYFLTALTIVTSLSLYELLGVHICGDTSHLNQLLENDDVYGVIDLTDGFYWRRDQVIEDSYKPTQNDQFWLERHCSWAYLPIPSVILEKLRSYLNIVEPIQIFSLPQFCATTDFDEILNQACRKIRFLSGSNRKITRRNLRRSLYTSISKLYGAHNAALILANNEFGVSTWHYYMAMPVNMVKERYEEGFSSLLGEVCFYSDHSFDNECYVGSQLTLSTEVFRNELSRVVSNLNDRLKGVRQSVDIEWLKETYNLLVSYTLVMCMAATCHRRNASCSFEHTCWNGDYSMVLVADKIHDAESATRYIPVPEEVTRQIRRTFGWIEQIAKRVKVSDPTIASTLLLSTSRRGGVPFLGVWTDKNKLLSPNTNQIKILMGECWELPFNTLRQCVFQRLLWDPNASSFLSTQMGHIGEGMHIFQNTSLQTLDAPNIEMHRGIIEKVLRELGFISVDRTKFTYKNDHRSRPIWTNGAKRKNQKKNRTNKKLAKSALRQAFEQAKKGDGGLYENLSVLLASNTSAYELAMELLQKFLGSTDDINGLDDSTLLSIFKGKYQSPARVKSTLPFETAHSAALLPKVDDAVDEMFLEALSGMPFPLDYLNLFIYVSLLVEGHDLVRDGFPDNDDGKSLEIRNIQLVSGYLIGECNKQRVMLAGRSALMLVHTLEIHKSSYIRLDKQRLTETLQQAFNDKLGHKPADEALRRFLKKLNSVTGPQRLGLSWLATVLKPAPRPNENGVLFGIRHHTIESRPLSDHAFLRLVMPSKFLGNRNLDITRIEHKTTPFRATARRSTQYDKARFKDFSATFRASLETFPNNPFDGVVSCWNKMVNCDDLSSLKELVGRSHDLPELIVMVLCWLFKASGRKGKNRPRLATSTIKTYFSRIVPILWDEIGNRSLVGLDYDDLLQHYQNVVDAGEDIESRGERARNLVDFHNTNRELFGLCDIDFNDLDVETPDKLSACNIITPNEYETAFELLLRDDSLSITDRYINTSILILCYRLGLRRMECGRILYGDWNVPDGILHIRSNRFGRTKSRASNRRIPYHLFLNETELEILRAAFGDLDFNESTSTLPIFGHPQFPDKLRRLEPHFARVIEALKVSTGDESARLHDCRHSFITFVALGLIIADEHQDSIAQTVRSWFKQDSLSDFRAAFTLATINVPSTKAVQLPALALMVGHSSATVTIRNYLHLTDYWRWMAIERHFRGKKTLDSVVVNWAGIDKKKHIERKHYFKMSSSFTVMPTVVDRIPYISAYDDSQLASRKSLDYALSSREPNSVSDQLRVLQEVDEVLRHLEYVDLLCSQTNASADTENDLEQTVGYQLERNNLTQSLVDRVNSVYQRVLRDVVTSLSYGVVSRDEYVVFPSPKGQAVAASYLQKEEFYELAESLLMLKQRSPRYYITILNDWATSWDAGKRAVHLLGSKCEDWQRIFMSMGIEIGFGEERVFLRNQLNLRCRSLESIELRSGTKIKIRMFGHAMFLLTMLEHLE